MPLGIVSSLRPKGRVLTRSLLPGAQANLVPLG